METEWAQRLEAARDISREAGELALGYFQQLDHLTVEHKGHQDLVSEADRNVELLIRRCLSERFPEDGVVGEEHAPSAGSSGYTWVIDPIDGTSNFLAGIPAWVVVLACVFRGKTVLGVVFDPNQNELFTAALGHGAYRNGQVMAVSHSAGLGQGAVGVGYSNRVRELNICAVISELIARGGMFYRNASGALSLVYVADGRLLGYVEEHMNAWDCLAGQLLVQEAGGRVEPQNADQMIANGGRVVVGISAVFDTLQLICDQSFDPAKGV
ncbi:MAG: inositol monophosphatase family protein [Granulosicoccaceae bacterium]